MKRYPFAAWIILLCLVFPFSVHAASIGDVNADGAVTMEDAISALRITAGTQDAANTAPSVDGSGKVGLSAVLYIMQALLGLRSNSATTETANTSGTIVFPSGFALRPSSLIVASATGTVAVGSSGSYTVTEPAGGGAATVFLMDANDNVIMLGHVDTDNPSFNEISPSSTAVELLFFATTAYTLPQSVWSNIYILLAAAPETATLAGVISARMAVNPTAVGDMDAAIVEAIDAAVASLMPEITASATTQTVKTQGEFKTQTAFTAQGTFTAQDDDASNKDVQTAPSSTTPNPAYGVSVGPSNDHLGIVITNESRINRFYFVYRTGFIPAGGTIKDGSMRDTTPWELVDFGLLPAVSGPSGFSTTVVDYFSGKVAWNPVDTPTITLPLSPADAVANRYQVYVVGMAKNILDDPTDLKERGDAVWVRNSMYQMFLYQAVKEFMWPLLTKILPLNDSTNIWKDKDKVMAAIANFVKQSGSLGMAWQQQIIAEPTNVGKACVALIKAIVGAGQGQAADALKALLKELNGYIGGFDTWRLKKLVDRFFGVLKWTDGLLTAGDMGFIAYQIANSNSYNIWDVSATAATLMLSPEDATLTSAQQTAPFSVKATGYLPATLTYEWRTSASYGTFQTSCGTGDPIICKGSQLATYSLTDKTNLPSVSNDIFTVKVSDTNGVLLGTLTGVVHFGNVVIKPYTIGKTFWEGAQQTFEVSLTSGEIPPGTNVTWKLTSNGRTSGTIDGGTATVTSPLTVVDYVAPMNPVTDLLEVQLIDSTSKLLGRTSTLINVVSGLTITPNKSLALGAKQDYTVSAANGFTLPSNADYRWTVKGDGTLNGGNPTITSTPTVTYTAPNASTTDTLTVQVVDKGRGKIVAQEPLDINVGIITWTGTSYTVTNEDSFPIYDESTMEILEYQVDATHVYFIGTSSDSHGARYNYNCGTKTSPATVSDNGNGTATITLPYGCYIISTTGDACSSTIPITAMIQSANTLYVPGAMYTWTSCHEAKTKSAPFTLTGQ